MAWWHVPWVAVAGSLVGWGFHLALGEDLGAALWP